VALMQEIVMSMQKALRQEGKAMHCW
jgi:hypothetical protein